MTLVDNILATIAKGDGRYSSVRDAHRLAVVLTIFLFFLNGGPCHEKE